MLSKKLKKKENEEDFAEIPQNLNPTQQALTDYQQEMLNTKKERSFMTFTKIDPSQSNDGFENISYSFLNIQNQKEVNINLTKKSQQDSRDAIPLISVSNKKSALTLSDSSSLSTSPSLLEQLQKFEENFGKLSTIELMDIQCQLTQALIQCSQLVKKRLVLEKKI